MRAGIRQAGQRHGRHLARTDDTGDGNQWRCGVPAHGRLGQRRVHQSRAGAGHASCLPAVAQGQWRCLCLSGQFAVAVHPDPARSWFRPCRLPSTWPGARSRRGRMSIPPDLGACAQATLAAMAANDAVGCADPTFAGARAAVAASVGAATDAITAFFYSNVTPEDGVTGLADSALPRHDRWPEHGGGTQSAIHAPTLASPASPR